MIPLTIELDGITTSDVEDIKQFFSSLDQVPRLEFFGRATQKFRALRRSLTMHLANLVRDGDVPSISSGKDISDDGRLTEQD